MLRRQIVSRIRVKRAANFWVVRFTNARRLDLRLKRPRRKASSHTEPSQKTCQQSIGGSFSFWLCRLFC